MLERSETKVCWSTRRVSRCRDNSVRLIDQGQWKVVFPIKMIVVRPLHESVAFYMWMEGIPSYFTVWLIVAHSRMSTMSHKGKCNRHTVVFHQLLWFSVAGFSWVHKVPLFIVLQGYIPLPSVCYVALIHPTKNHINPLGLKKRKSQRCALLCPFLLGLCSSVGPLQPLDKFTAADNVQC